MRTTLLGRRTMFLAFVSLIVLSGVMGMSMNTVAYEGDETDHPDEIPDQNYEYYRDLTLERYGMTLEELDAFYENKPHRDRAAEFDAKVYGLMGYENGTYTQEEYAAIIDEASNSPSVWDNSIWDPASVYIDSGLDIRARVDLAPGENYVSPNYAWYIRKSGTTGAWTPLSHTYLGHATLDSNEHKLRVQGMPYFSGSGDVKAIVYWEHEGIVGYEPDWGHSHWHFPGHHQSGHGFHSHYHMHPGDPIYGWIEEETTFILTRNVVDDDNTAPTVTIALTTTGYDGSSGKIDVTASDADSGIYRIALQRSVSGGSYSTIKNWYYATSGTYNIPSTLGTFRYRVVAQDNDYDGYSADRKWSAWAYTYTFTIADDDALPPIVDNVYEDGNVWNKYPPTVKEISDAGDDLLFVVVEGHDDPNSYDPSGIESIKAKDITTGVTKTSNVVSFTQEDHHKIKIPLINDISHNAEGTDVAGVAGYEGSNAFGSVWFDFGGALFGESTDNIDVYGTYAPYTIQGLTSAEVGYGLPPALEAAYFSYSIEKVTVSFVAEVEEGWADAIFGLLNGASANGNNDLKIQYKVMRGSSTIKDWTTFDEIDGDDGNGVPATLYTTNMILVGLQAGDEFYLRVWHDFGIAPGFLAIDAKSALLDSMKIDVHYKWDLDAFSFFELPKHEDLATHFVDISLKDADDDRSNDALTTTQRYAYRVVDDDTTPPTTTINYYGGSTDGNPGQVIWTAMDDSDINAIEIEVSQDGGAWTLLESWGTKYSGSISVPRELGTYQYRIRAQDDDHDRTGDRLWSAWLTSELIEIEDDDETGPVITAVYMGGDSTDGRPGFIRFTATDPESGVMDGTTVVEELIVDVPLNPTIIDAWQPISSPTFVNGDKDRTGDQEDSSMTVIHSITDDDNLYPVIDADYYGDNTDNDPGYVWVNAYDPINPEPNGDEDSGLSIDPSDKYYLSDEMDDGDILGDYDFSFSATDADNDRPDDELTWSIDMETITIRDDDEDAPEILYSPITVDNYADAITIPLTINDYSGISSVEVTYNGETKSANLVSGDLYEVEFDLAYILGEQTFTVVATDNDDDLYRTNDKTSTELMTYTFYMEDAIIYDMELSFDNLDFSFGDQCIIATYDLALDPELNYRGQRYTDFALGSATTILYGTGSYTVGGNVWNDIGDSVSLTGSFEFTYDDFKQLLLDELEELRQMVEDSPLECWKDSHNRNNNDKLAENAKSAMLDKIDLTIDMIGDDLITDAYDKLLHDIKPKLTALKEDKCGVIFGNGVFNNPWFYCEEGQAAFEDKINGILWGLNNL